MKKTLNTIKKKIIPKTIKKIVNLENGKAGGRDAGHVLIVTHGAAFHPDDVCATAAALLYYGVDKTGLGKFLPGYEEIQKKHDGEFVRVVRTLDKDVMKKATILLDVGREYDEKTNRFDHHQGGITPREDGVMYSSFGLFWKKFGKKITGNSEVSEFVDKIFVKHIDSMDNGMPIAKSLFEDQTPPLLFEDLINFDADLVFGLNLSEKEINKVFDKTFFKLIPIAQKMLILTALKGYAQIEAKKKFQEFYSRAKDKRVIIMDQKTPFKSNEYREPLFMVYPSLRGGWAGQAVRINDLSWDTKVQFPESWAGKEAMELRAITGVDDATFAHLGRFLISAETKEGVLKMIQIVLTDIENDKIKPIFND